jgi:O-methyltransferase
MKDANMLTSVKRAGKKLLLDLGYDLVPSGKLPSDFTEQEKELVRRVSPYTMTTPERIYGLKTAVEYLVAHDVPGTIVECGVWRGGSMMVVADTLLSLGATERDLYLFDTFEGMTKPTKEDGDQAMARFEQQKTGDDSSDWCYASLADVQACLGQTGYPPNKIHFVKGKVEETIPEQAPEEIALLRLDTDWYTSTRHELVHLFPRLVKGGVLFIDDYGRWQGARQAIDEYFSQNNIKMLLNRLDTTGRIGIK